MYGDNHPEPTVELTVIIDDQPYLLTVGVVEKLLVVAILGWELLLTEYDSGKRGELRMFLVHCLHIQCQKQVSNHFQTFAAF